MAISVAITLYPQLIAVLSDVECMLTHRPQLPGLLGELRSTSRHGLTEVVLSAPLRSLAGTRSLLADRGGGRHLGLSLPSIGCCGSL